MKQIINGSQQIELNDLEIPLGMVIYERISWDHSSRFAMLTKLSTDKNWGFVDIGGHDTSPTYVNSTFNKSIKSAIDSGRKVYQMNNITELNNL